MAEDKKLKVFLIIDETTFYHPFYADQLFKDNRFDWVGGCINVSIPKKNSLEAYLKKNIFKLKITEIFKLAWMRFLSLFLNKVAKAKGPFTVASSFELNGVPFIETKNSLNQPGVLDYIKSTEPDVIISSNSLYFGQELLALPRLACINRHSGLLPSYGGLWPVFQAVGRGERLVGVTIHTMSKKIDSGEILEQEGFEVGAERNLGNLYEKCFVLSAKLTLSALDKISKGATQPLTPTFEPSYYSFPGDEDWERFRKAGFRFI